MKVLNVQNVHEALPLGLDYLRTEGIERGSRNGPVLVAPGPVTTVYEKPLERVIFWPSRDANPFFHLYEALWMLAGRDDLKPLLKYAKQMNNYSDDGHTLWGSYGKRWRGWFEDFHAVGIRGEWPIKDQLPIIARRLKDNPDDRRCVLQMWDANSDLDYNGKDVPCNTIATFQRDHEGKLHLVVFCRSNDVIWGAYGANAVHMSFLLEYMALWIGCPVGTYSQVSVNYHAYLNTMQGLENIDTQQYELLGQFYGEMLPLVQPISMLGSIDYIDDVIEITLEHVDKEFTSKSDIPTSNEPWALMVYQVLKAHHIYKNTPKPDNFQAALEVLPYNSGVDWIVAARQWILRREFAWNRKNS